MNPTGSLDVEASEDRLIEYDVAHPNSPINLSDLSDHELVPWSPAAAIAVLLV